MSQGFGCTSFAFEPIDLACPGGHWHSGIDLAAARGTPVMATLPGVATVIVSATGYGLHVIIDHGGGLSSLYGHLDTVLDRERRLRARRSRSSAPWARPAMRPDRICTSRSAATGSPRIHVWTSRCREMS